jgi:hypothetical protein
MPALVAPAERAALRARLALTPRRWSVAPAGTAAMPASLVLARRARRARLAPLSAAVVALAAPAAPVEQAAIAARVALVAVALPGRAAAVVWAWQAVAALVAVAAQVAPASMRAVSVTARLVGMREQVALVAWVALRAPWAPTPPRWSVALAGLAVTPEQRARARRV